MLHDDDMLHPNYLEYAIKAINRNKNISIICSGMESTYRPNKDSFKKYSYNPKFFNTPADFISLIYLGFPLNFAAVIYKTENLKKINLLINDNLYGKIADRPLVFEAINNGTICLFTGQYIQYRIHKNQDSRNSKTGPFYNQTIALHKKYKDIIFKDGSFVSKLFFLLNFYRYLKEEYNRFYQIELSFDDYLKIAINEVNINIFELAASKLFYFIRVDYFYKFYRLLKRKFGEYS